MTRFWDSFFDSINEFFDVIVFSFIASYIYSGLVLHDSWLMYVYFPLVPLFIVYSPYIFGNQRRSTPELIIKTLLYLLVGFGTFYGTYLTVGDLWRRNVAPIFLFLLFFVFAFMLLVWVIRSLVKSSKEEVFVPYKERKRSKSTIFSLIIAAVSWMFTFSTFGSLFSDNTLGGFDQLIYFVIGLVSGVVAIISTLFLFMSLFQRKR